MTILEIVEKLRVWGFAGVRAYVLRTLNNRVQARRLRTLAKQSRCANPERGVTVLAELTGQVSLSKTMRDFVLSLREAGIPCQAYDINAKCEIPISDATSLITPPTDFDLKRYDHIVEMFRAPLDPTLVPGITIGRIAFYESEHGIHETFSFLRESGDDIIAMSDFNYDYYKRAFTKQRVCKITYPLRLDMSQATPRDELRKKFGIGAEDFLVYFNFDFGSFYRKNIPAALRAFALAFEDVPNAKLLFKTKGARKNPREVWIMERLVSELNIGGKFVHVASYLPQADIFGLSGACDVYLSLQKSEGFGLGMAEAMAQGRPVVVTGWSANTEFCRPDNSCCVSYRLVPIQPHEYPPAMKEWADADVQEAAQALRKLYDEPELREQLGQKGRDFLEEHFSLANFKRDVEVWLDGK